MKVVFLLSQVVIVISMVVSTILETALSSGALPRKTETALLHAICTISMAL
jgi:hypothetical protein